MKSAQMGLGEVKAKFSKKDKATGDVIELEAVVLDQSAANQALQMLGKIDMIGLFMERSKVELSKTFEEQTDDELDAFIAANSNK
jgi:hypothetical protein